ncbi:MAG: thioesterase family protein [Oscillospiraceae bacterium]|nr:thioesterase family protein [Oscillospiraceae bacterium]
MNIEIGLKGRAETVVTPENTASAVGSGLVPVFATPAMVALMERAAASSLAPYLEEGQGSVGVHLDVSHQSATPVGLKVWAESEVTAVEGKQITFSVAAYDEAGLIGQGTHKRVCITVDRFLSRAEQKKPG